MSARGRRTRMVVVTAALGLLTALAPAQGALAGTGAGTRTANPHPGAPGLAAAQPVAVAPVRGGTQQAPATQHRAPVAPTAQALPAAGSGTADLTASGTSPVSAGKLPVRVGPDGSGPAPASVKVEMADQKTATQAGVNGLLLRVTRADGRADASRVAVSVDYSGFAHAFGGNWASSLRLVQMPACAFTTPGDPRCQTRTPLPSSSDGGAHRVSATISLGGTGAGVLAATATVAGSQGDYAATPLKEAETWTGGTSTGDFLWSYPIRMPPGIGAQAPQVALDYDSARLDGTTASYNSQSGWIGAGFDYEPGFITRSYQSCKDAGVSSDLGDLCWRYDNATLSLGGQTIELVKDDTTGWHPRHDDGSRIEYLTGASNGAYNGEYWKVTTVDGTQYYFGLNHLPGWSSGNDTNSVWTVPVYGPDSGDPCYDSSGFDASVCLNMAWQWNLDMVVDPHGNAETFFYSTETNNYARDASSSTLKGTPTGYTRAGHLDTIYYGLRSDNVFPAVRPMKVHFGTDPRCTDTAGGCGTTDVPWYLDCDSGDDCAGQISPSFWTNVKLTSITTSVYQSTAYANVDTYSIGSSMYDDGDGTRDLVVNTIGHTGDVGGSAPVPNVTFGYVPLANRVDFTVDGENLGPLNRARLASIDSESGAFISVTYSNPSCPSPRPDPSNNTAACFPQFWEEVQPPASPDWFNKYDVTDVKVSDNTGGSVAQLYHYSYDQGGGAWHYTDDNGLVPDKFKTWSEWRGFQSVEVTAGASGDPRTRTRTLVFRGMNGDRTASGGTKSAQVTDSRGVSMDDDPALEAFTRETIVYDGPGGSEVSGSIFDPWTSRTGKNVRSWGTVTSDLRQVGASHDRIDLASGGVRTTEVDFSYDSHGLEVMQSDLGDVASPTPRCTITTYAADSDAWMLDYPAEVQSTGRACPATPPTSGTLALPTDPSLVISDTRSSYDGQAWGTAPTAGGGSVTTVQAASAGGSSPTFITTATMAYDQYGRVTSSADALGRTTSTDYNPSSGGALTQTVVTDPARNTITTNYDPSWGLATSKLDVNGERTDLTYDPLGRLTAAWLPGQVKGHDLANVTYAYQVNDDSASSVTTGTLLPSGLAYRFGYQLYDGQLRLRQTQDPAVDATGRVITDTYYNSVGELFKTTKPYYDNQASAGTKLVAPVLDTSVPGEDVTAFDGARRPTSDTFEALGVAQWQTTTTYGGDRVTVTPPQGGTATTTIVDARGQQVQLCQYHDLSPSGSCGAGKSDSTTYTYYPNGRQHQLTDPAGNTWTTGYDFLGNPVSKADVDAGTSTSVYDNAGQVTSTTDAAGQQLSYVYDALGHRTQEWAGAVGTGTQLAEWDYYTTGVYKEQPSSQTRFQDGSSYTINVDSYDPGYRPTSTTYVIPSNEGALAGKYNYTAAYNPDGSLASETYPAAGGLARETVAHTYDGNFGVPLRTIGQTDYVEQSQYTVFGQVAQLAFGTSTSSQWSYLANVFDDSTFRLSQQLVTQDATPKVQAANIAYTYDPTGNLLGAADTPLGDSDANNVECYQYDYLRRLTQAWSQASSGCASAPSGSAMGGASPYWSTYAYDLTGNRTSVVRHSASGGSNDTTITNTYPAPGQPDPHFMSSQTQVGAGGTGTVTRAHDANGDLRSVTSPTGVQTFSWTPDGSLAKVSDSASGNVTTFAYDAGGKQLIVHDPSSTALHLPDQDVVVDKSGNVSVTRYYRHGGQTIAVRTVSPTNAQKLDWLIPDQHGTDDLFIDASSQAVTRRYSDPFGAPRGPAPSSWPGDQGFVGGAADPATGLTDIGAREYSAQDGQFLSPDPVIDGGVPQQLNGYSYALNNPTTYSDPTGLLYCCGGSGGGGGGGGGDNDGSSNNGGSSGCGACGSSGGINPWVAEYQVFATQGYTTAPPTPPRPKPPVPHPWQAGIGQGTCSSKASFEMGCGGLRPGSGGSGGGGTPGWLRTVGHGLGWVISEDWHHAFVEGSLCFVVCVSLTFQGGHVLVGWSAWSVTKPITDMFAGVATGLYRGTVADRLRDNIQFGGVAADGLGGGVGATIYRGPHGLGSLHPYAEMAVGTGWQANAGVTHTIDLNEAIPSYLDRTLIQPIRSAFDPTSWGW